MTTETHFDTTTADAQLKTLIQQLQAVWQQINDKQQQNTITLQDINAISPTYSPIITDLVNFSIAAKNANLPEIAARAMDEAWYSDDAFFDLYRHLYDKPFEDSLNDVYNNHYTEHTTTDHSHKAKPSATTRRPRLRNPLALPRNSTRKPCRAIRLEVTDHDHDDYHHHHHDE